MRGEGIRAMKRILTLLMGCLMTLSVARADTVTLSFVGDCSIGERVESAELPGNYTLTLAEKGYEWPFSLVRDCLEADDFTFANNEVVFTARKNHLDKRTNLKGPGENAQAYLYSGIDAVNTANNHAMDFYLEGYDDTLTALDTYGINHFGTLYPDTNRERDYLGIYDVGDLRIGVMGFSYPQDSDIDRISMRAQALRGAGCALVIVSLHWGREVSDTPENWQFSYARKVIDAGADVLWGHGPHILQQVQFYQGKPIFYSTGNFTFGSMSAVDPDTGIFQLRYEVTEGMPQLVNFTVIPCRTQGHADFRPYPLTDADERRRLLTKLIYRRWVDGMQNLPASFADTGSVDLQNGFLPQE